MRIHFAAVVVLVAGSAVQANLVNLGNLVATNSPQTTNITGITGGPYNRFTLTTNWSYNSGTSPTSNAMAFNFVIGSNTSVISALSSISGMLPNSNPTTVTVSGSLSVNVSASTAMQLLYAQNLGGIARAANWSNTTINFTYVAPPPRTFNWTAMGVRGNTVTPFSITTDGSSFATTIGLYSENGNLLATNQGGTPGGTDMGLTNLFLPEGEYLIFVAGAGATLGIDEWAASAAPGAAGGTLAGLVGDGGWLNTSFGEGDGHWYSFSIIPAPGAATAGMLGLGLLAVRRRRA